MQESAQSTPTEALSPDAKMWAMFCHLSALIGYVFPFGNIIAPMVIWMIKKDEFPFVDEQGKEALNFQISLTIYVIASVILIFVAIGILLLIALGIFELIAIVIAALKANNGEKFKYPLSIQFLK